MNQSNDEQLAGAIKDAVSVLNDAIFEAADAGLEVEFKTTDVGYVDGPDYMIFEAKVRRIISA